MRLNQVLIDVMNKVNKEMLNVTQYDPSNQSLLLTIATLVAPQPPPPNPLGPHSRGWGRGCPTNPRDVW